MFEVKGEGLTDAEVTALTNYCATVCTLAHKAATGSGDRVKWFGANAASMALTENLKTMDEYLNKKCTKITFVRKNTGQIIDQVAADPNDYGQVIPNVMTTTANFKKSAKHTSSGLRVFAMNEIVDAIATSDTKEALNYVYHEVSHKVLDTVDFKYGEAACELLASTKPARAIRNADNYGYFIAEIT